MTDAAAGVDEPDELTDLSDDVALLRESQDRSLRAESTLR